MPDFAPLILTLTLDPASQAYFEALRRQHFPPALNHLAAHVTLFHHLPGAEEATIRAQLRAFCQVQPALPLHVAGLRFLGRGVAFQLENDALRTLHQRLQTGWQAWLTPQDRQKLTPHVTVQNKVAPEAARQLLADLAADFQPFFALGTGLQLWHHRNGPWEWAAAFGFGENNN